MGKTIYASFGDANLAERSVGALLDRGVRPEDISVVRKAFEPELESSDFEGAAIPPLYKENGFMGSRAIEENRLGTQGGDYGSAILIPSIAETPQEIAYESVSYGRVANSASEEDVDESNRPTTYSEINEGVAAGIPRQLTSQLDDIERAAKTGISTTTAEDAGAGALKGLGWGAGIGILAGIASLAIPGVGIVVGGGALATAIGGMLATTGAGAIAGGITGYLKDQGMEEHVAAQYDRHLNDGGAIIAVTVPSGQLGESQICDVLEKYGATTTYPKAAVSVG